jgi:glycosyltransferase involved in cell wall biosynthesis
VTRILVVTLRYPPHHVGGYEVSCRDVAERLVERGHEVAVLTSTLRQPGVDDPADEGHGPIPVERSLTAWFRDDDLWAPPFRERWRVERANQRALAAALDRHRPDVVSVWHLGAMSLGLVTTLARRRQPLLYAVSDDWLSYSLVLDAWTSAFGRWPRPLARAVAPLLGVPTTVPDLGATGPFCFISEDTRRRAAAHSPWSMEDTAIVYSGIDGRLFGPDPAAPVPRPWGGRLLYVGRYDPRKGIECAIRALVHLPAAALEVQGTGDPGERARLEALAADLGVGGRVECGDLPRAGLVARYRACDALVFPSEWEEPFGLTPLEAMACGTPVVATGVGGSGEFLLDGRNCLRFAAGDPVDLAAAVERLAGDADLRARLHAEGLRTARVLDVDHLAECFDAWHRAVADPSRPRPASRSFEAELADV